MVKNEWYFYLSIAIATIASEISIRLGLHFCIAPLAVLAVAYVGFKTFPKKKPPI